MKKRNQILAVMALVLLMGGCLLTTAAAGNGVCRLTARADWSLGDGWQAKDCPAGLWLQYAGSASSIEALQYAKTLSGDLEVSYYLRFLHTSDTVDCSTIVLRQSGGDVKYLFRIKGCNGDVMVGAQRYDGSSWTSILDETAWNVDAGNTVSVTLKSESDSGITTLTVKNGIKTIYSLDTSADTTGFLQRDLSLYLGCDEGNLAMTNVRIKSN